MNNEEQSMIYAPYINNYIFDLIPQNKKVLDVGCNVGNLGEKLIKEKKCEVWGIDYSIKAIELAKGRLTKAIVFDLENEGVPFLEEKFDVIVFADVLEHLKNPELVLRKFSTILSDEGIIVVSVPNVANIHIRSNLFFGRWNYEESGILDRTHLKFFTKKTIRESILNSDYNIIKIKSTPGFNFIFFRYFSFLKKIAEYLCLLNNKLFALQFIIVAKKKIN